MHPYEMQKLIHERKKDEFLDLKRGSLYQNIGRLEQRRSDRQGGNNPGREAAGAHHLPVDGCR